MGTHHLDPDQTGFGSKVSRVVGGHGALRAAYDIGHTIYDVARFVAPYAGRAVQAGRAALPLISAAL